MAKKRDTQQSAISPIYVICGENAFLVSKQTETLLDTLLEPEQRAMALYEPRAEDASISDVLDELRTLPFLAEKRIVLIKDAEKFASDNQDAIIRYLDNPSSSGILIMTSTAWDKRKKIHKTVQSHGQILEIDTIKSYQLPEYIAGYASRQGIQLNQQCSRFLVELVGDDPGRLCSELDKLSLFAAPRTTISIQDIEALIGQNRMFDAFGVIDAVTAGQAGTALARLRNMLQSDKSAEYSVVGAFGYHFRRLFKVKALIARGNSAQQAATMAGIRFRQKEFLSQVALLSLNQLGWIMAELGKIDYQMKTGQTTASVAIERLIMRLVSMQRKTA